MSEPLLRLIPALVRKAGQGIRVGVCLAFPVFYHNVIPLQCQGPTRELGPLRYCLGEVTEWVVVGHDYDLGAKYPSIELPQTPNHRECLAFNGGPPRLRGREAVAGKCYRQLLAVVGQLSQTGSRGDG